MRNEDSNLVWRVRTGHLIHLLEGALASIEALETLLSDTDGSGLNTDLTKPLGSADGRAASLTGGAEAVSHREKPVGRRGWIPGDGRRRRREPRWLPSMLA